MLKVQRVPTSSGQQVAEVLLWDWGTPVWIWPLDAYPETHTCVGTRQLPHLPPLSCSEAAPSVHPAHTAEVPELQKMGKFG